MKRRTRPLNQIAAAIGLSLALAGCSQLELGRLYFANNGTEAKLVRALPATMPFREDNGWIIVQARVNGAGPVDFVIDTGASMIAILESERTDALKMDMRDVRKLGSPDELAAPTAAVQRDMDLDFGPVVLMDQTVLAIPLETVRCSDEVRDIPFQGVIGHELFHRYVVEINYDRGEVVLHDPETYRYTGTGEIVSADISGRQPFVNARVTSPDGRAYDARLHVDSGAGIDLSLFPQTHADIQVPAGGTTKDGCFVGGLAKYQTGTSVDLGFGDGRATTTPADYSIGDEVIDTGQNGRIGSRFLRRHNVVFDYSRGQMILEPRAKTTTAGVAPLDPDGPQG